MMSLKGIGVLSVASAVAAHTDPRRPSPAREDLLQALAYTVRPESFGPVGGRPIDVDVAG